MREYARGKARQFLGRNKAMGFGRVQVLEPAVAAPASIGETMTISNADGYEVQLVELLPDAPTSFEPKSEADILCLDIHKFGIGRTIDWVEQAQGRIADDEMPLCIVAIGNEKDLSVRDLWRVSEELEPAGAIFHRWPEGCDSFSDAFHRFGESVRAIYGLPTVVSQL